MLNKILGDQIFYKLTDNDKSIRLSNIKKTDIKLTKIIYYDYPKTIKDFINLEMLLIDMDLFKKDSKSILFKGKWIALGKYKYMKLENFPKLKLLYLDNVIGNYQSNFFEFLFANVSFNFEILILNKNVDESFDTILNFLTNLPCSLKYIIFISPQKEPLIAKRIYFNHKLKIPFGCKIIHCIKYIYSNHYYYEKTKFIIIDEYEEET